MYGLWSKRQAKRSKLRETKIEKIMPLPELASGKLSEISDETGVLCLFKLFANRQSDGNREWDARKIC